jgi:hypothetical protein
MAPEGLILEERVRGEPGPPPDQISCAPTQPLEQGSYASIGVPQLALSIEVKPDVLLRYIPTGDEVVGVTMLNFLKHFPLPPRTPLLTHATAVVKQLLQHYPQVPMSAIP